MKRLKLLTVLGMFPMLMIYLGACTNKHLTKNEEEKRTGSFDSIIMDTAPTQPREKESVYHFLKYADKLMGYGDSAVIRGLCSMTHYDGDNWNDSIDSMLSKRRINLYSSINDTVANIIQALFLYYESINNDDILFYINSPGGGVYAGLGIYDVMQFASCDVRTVCSGMACSMAAVLLMSGKEGKRFAYSKSRIMIHKPRSEVDVQDDDAEITEDEIQKLQKELFGIISEHCHQPYDKVLKDCENDYWMTSIEAKEYGIIDVIL